jgi:hypothetical protein
MIQRAPAIFHTKALIISHECLLDRLERVDDKIQIHLSAYDQEAADQKSTVCDIPWSNSGTHHQSFTSLEAMVVF